MKKPTRIIHIVGSMSNGGVETLLMNYYRNIDRSKFQFDFVVNQNSTHIRRDEIESLGGHVFVVPNYESLLSYSSALKKIFLEGSYPIVHSHINTLSVFPLRIAKEAGIPIRIAHAHSTTAPKEIARNAIKQILRPFCAKYATNLAACSLSAGTWMFGSKNTTNGTVKIIKNAIDLNKFAFSLTTRESLRKELNVAPNEHLIGHVGRFVTVKNHEYILQVFQSILSKQPAFKLLLIGDGELFQQIKNTAKKMGISERVIFLGSKNEVSQYYSAMDSFIFPSLYEGLGQTLIEAQANGLPCCVSSEVPSEAILCDNVSRLPIEKKDILAWSHFFSSHPKRLDFKTTQQILTNAGYSITMAAPALENYYSVLLSERQQSLLITK